MTKPSLKFAISSCPNDTFSFYQLFSGQHKRYLSEPFFYDIQQLNTLAQTKQMDVIKISVNKYKDIAQDYILLPVGLTLGFGVGPKLIAPNFFDINELEKKHVAIPGKDTTAHFLLNTLCPPVAKKSFCVYHEVLDKVLKKQVDAGLIIHETRFTFSKQNAVELLDLGKLWEERFKLPLPLGAIAAKRSLGDRLLKDICEDLFQSLCYSQQHPQKSQDFVLTHSIEKNLHAVESHIALYVNQDSTELSDLGKKALEHFFSLQQANFTQGWLYEPSLSCSF